MVGWLLGEDGRNHEKMFEEDHWQIHTNILGVTDHCS